MPDRFAINTSELTRQFGDLNAEDHIKQQLCYRLADHYLIFGTLFHHTK